MARIQGTKFNDDGIERPSLVGTVDPDNISGGKGNDLLVGFGGDDKLAGGDGDDILDGSAGADTMSGDAGNDLIFAGFGDTIRAGSGNDTIAIFEVPASIDGGSGSDTASIINNFSVEEMASLASAKNIENWLIAAGRFFDFEAFTTGVNVSTASNPSVTRATGALGSGFADTMTGGTGTDALYGQAGNDSINGGEGGDDLAGVTGTDTLTGGPGPDTFVFLALDEGVDTITDFNPEEDAIGLIETLPGLAESGGLVYYYESTNPVGELEPGPTDPLYPAVLYDTDDGIVYYDPVVGGTDARQLAVLEGSPPPPHLDHGNFRIMTDDGGDTAALTLL